MQKLAFLGALSLLLSASACFIDIDDDDGLFGCVDGNGPFVTEVLDVPPFDELVVRMGVTVHLKQGPVQEVLVEGIPNIIDELELDVDNGEWEIETDDCVRDIGPMTFFITVVDLDRIEVTGDGTVIGDEFLTVQDIELRVSGSGELNLGLLADDIYTRVSGSGDVFLEGTADEHELRISGAGDVRAFDLATNECEVNVSGSGDGEVTVSTWIHGRISGSGDVYFRGFPEIDVDISGSGNLVDAN